MRTTLRLRLIIGAIAVAATQANGFNSQSSFAPPPSANTKPTAVLVLPARPKLTCAQPTLIGVNCFHPRTCARVYACGSYFYGYGLVGYTSGADGGYAYVSNDSPSRDTREYYQRGQDWAQDLRRDVVTWEQFVAYLRSDVVNATETQRNEFRRGFVAGYGANADAALDKAMQETGSPPAPTGPKVITMPPAKASGRTD
jgi:hypothetical protein